MSKEVGAGPAFEEVPENGGQRVARSSEETLSPRMRRRRRRRAVSVEKEWYSKSEAASYPGVAEITVTRYLQKGVLHALRLPLGSGESSAASSRYGYGRLRIHKAELDRRLENVGRTATGPSTRRGGNEEPNRGASRVVASIESGRLRPADYFKCADRHTRAHVYRAEVAEFVHLERSSRAPENE